MIRELIEHIYEEEIFKPADAAEVAARNAKEISRQAEYRKQLVSDPEAKTKLFFEVQDQVDTSYERVPGDFWYNDEEDEYVDAQGNIVDTTALSDAYTQENFSTWVSVQVVPETHIRQIKDELDRVLDERKLNEEEIFKPASKDELSTRPGWVEAEKQRKRQKEADAKREAERLQKLESGEYIDPYLGPAPGTRKCILCSRKIPKGTKFLGLNTPGRYGTQNVKVCKICLKHAVRGIESSDPTGYTPPRRT